MSRSTPQRVHRTWATRSDRGWPLASGNVTAECSSTRVGPPHAAQPSPAACGSTMDALVTSIGRVGEPPASRAASFIRASASFTAARSASRRSVLSRFAGARFFDIAPHDSPSARTRARPDRRRSMRLRELRGRAGSTVVFRRLTDGPRAAIGDEPEDVHDGDDGDRLDTAHETLLLRPCWHPPSGTGGCRSRSSPRAPQPLCRA
jgi:hypothetical protein